MQAVLNIYPAGWQEEMDESQEVENIKE